MGRRLGKELSGPEIDADGVWSRRNIVHQTEYLDNSLNWTKPFYPETFQTKTHEYQWSVIAKHPYIVASYLWNTFDFATPLLIAAIFPPVT